MTKGLDRNVRLLTLCLFNSFVTFVYNKHRIELAKLVD